MPHQTSASPKVRGNTRFRDARLRCESLEGRLAPGDWILGAAWLGLSLHGSLAEMAQDSPLVSNAPAVARVETTTPVLMPHVLAVDTTVSAAATPTVRISAVTQEDATTARFGVDALFAAVLADPLMPSGAAEPATNARTFPELLAATPNGVAATGPSGVASTAQVVTPPVAAAIGMPPTGRSGTVPGLSLIGATPVVNRPLPSTSQYYLQEWTIPTANSIPHDVISDDAGIIWFTEIGADKIGRFDPTTQQFLEFPLAAGADPHGLCPAPENGIWFTEQGGNRIGRIDRTTYQITEYTLPNAGSGPHTPIHDGNDHIWFTEQSGNRIGRINLWTRTIQEWTMPRAGTGPYGIVADAAGNAWFCEFGGTHNRIGRRV